MQVPAFTHAGGIVFEDDSSDRVLVVRPTRSADEWVLPKGHIEPGEGPVEAAVREVREESGAEAHTPEYVGYVAYTFRGEDVTCAYYAMTLATLHVAEEDRERQFKTLDELVVSLPYPETRALIARAIEARR